MIDTHSHLTDVAFDSDRNQVIQNYYNEGGKELLIIGCDYDEIKSTLDIVKTNNDFFCALGIHPEFAQNYDEKKLTDYINQAKDKIKAIGEIGLDYYYEKDNCQLQKNVFEHQLKLAKRLELPVIVHCRDAYGDCLEILRKNAPYKMSGIMHCFSGSLEFANEVIKLGFYISFSGSLTFKNAKNLQSVAKQIPLEKILVETDSPYLSPEGKRGKRNEPANVKEVIKKLSEIKNIDYFELEKILENNSKKILNL